MNNFSKNNIPLPIPPNSNEEPQSDSVRFTINGENHEVGVGCRLPLDYKLVDYIRDVANLKGTKVMCREGGCGACIVMVKRRDPHSEKEVVASVNSCLTPLLSCSGWNIFTIESLGNERKGYSKVQQQFHAHFGGQCGYCSPGMIMSMHSLMEAKEGAVSVEDVDALLDGNICRCTGYRPILDAFKSLAVDAPSCGGSGKDIEECLPKCTRPCSTITMKRDANGKNWATPRDLPTLQAFLQNLCIGQSQKVLLIAGNTGSGVYKEESAAAGAAASLFIDISHIPQLHKKERSGDGILLGAGVSLAAAIQFLKESKDFDGFGYATQIARHLGRVANTGIRNRASIGGNLMIKHNHPEFPSDVFMLLTTIGATLLIVCCKDASTSPPVEIRMEDFLKMDMGNKILTEIKLPPIRGSYHFKSYKITQRYQNSHAYVNAGFLFKFDDARTTLVERPTIVYGGIHPRFMHAGKAEDYLTKYIGTDLQELGASFLQGALASIREDTAEISKEHDGRPEYRRFLASSLLYKVILGIIPSTSPFLRSGASDIERRISGGRQTFSYDQDEHGPLFKSVEKSEGKWQASGEAEYTTDIPKRPGELFAAFVQSTVGCGTLLRLDASQALRIEGVVGFITAEDIPGKNDFMGFNVFPALAPEPVFVERDISYNGQALGLIVAQTREIAMAAVSKVIVEYGGEPSTPPLLDIEDAFKKAEASGTLPQHFLAEFTTPVDPSLKITHRIEGRMKTGAQAHFHMEPQNCLVAPKEGGIDVFSSTQWMDHVQNVISDVLAIPCNSITIKVKRIGGAFGGKITRPSHLAAAAAVAALKLGKPVRMSLEVEEGMSLMGKRLPFFMKYAAGFDEDGRIGELSAQLYCDPGYAPNVLTSKLALIHLQSLYKSLGWSVRVGYLTTNTPANVACRAPGSVQGVALIENVMEHVAHVLGKDPLEVRRVNFIQDGDALLRTPTGERIWRGHNLIESCIAEVENVGGRKADVAKFNRENRWKKRGSSLIPLRYPVTYDYGINIPVMIAIYHRDGSVTITHGGIEMGQGLNTKVIQTVSTCLKLPLEKIRIETSDNFVGANATQSAVGTASEVCCYGAMKACEILLERLKKVGERPTWEERVEAAHKMSIDLTASYLPGDADDLKGYDVWALSFCEVEIDVLTGEYKILRNDLVEDAGKSLSPGIDLGQIEGGWVFGQGFWTTEKIVYCKKTGKLLTNRSWNYKPPESKDIPEQFNIKLLKNSNSSSVGVLSSKSTGEAILCTSVSVYFALKDAIGAARRDCGENTWFELDAPLTPEDICLACLTKEQDLIL